MWNFENDSNGIQKLCFCSLVSEEKTLSFWFCFQLLRHWFSVIGVGKRKSFALCDNLFFFVKSSSQKSLCAKNVGEICAHETSGNWASKNFINCFIQSFWHIKLINLFMLTQELGFNPKVFFLLQCNFDSLCSCLSVTWNYKEREHNFLSMALVPKLSSRRLQL